MDKQKEQASEREVFRRAFAAVDEAFAALEGAGDVELALKGSADSQNALLLWITNILRKS